MKSYLNQSLFVLAVLVILMAFGCKADSKVTALKDQKVTASAKQQPVNTDTAATHPENLKPVAPTQGEKTVMISGKIGDVTDNQSAEIIKITYDNAKPEPQGQVKLKEDGSFEIKMKHSGKGVYSLKIGGQQMLFLLNGTEEKVNIVSSIGGFRTMSIDIKGADDNKRYYDIVKGASAQTMTLDELKEKTIEEPNPLLASLIALQLFKDPSFIELHKGIQKRLEKDPAVDKKLYKDGYAKYITSVDEHLSR